MPVLVVGDADTMIAVVSKLLRQLRFLDVGDARDSATALIKMRAKRLRLGDFRLEYGIDDGLRFLS
jgi:hypothetical protein